MRRTALLVAVAAGALVSCGSGSPGEGAGDCRPVVALVASSLVDAFGERAENPCAGEWKVTGGSSTALAAQVRGGSPADVFVSAGTKAIDQLRGERLTVGEPLSLGSVRATLYTTTEHTDGVTLRDLPGLVTDGWKVGLCVATAPCGEMADRLLANAASVWGDGFDRRTLVATEAESAADLVTKVAMGELDAAVIYEHVCVAPPNGELDGVCHGIPDTVNGRELNVRTPYLAVRLRAGENADSFMAHVDSEGFRTYLAERMRIT